MQVDVEALLQPISEEAPAGPDLSYDPEFRRISRELDALAEKEKPSEDPGVGPGAETAVGLLARSRDMWIASHAFCFALYVGDLDACTRLIEVLAGLGERFWDTCHPVLDEGSDPAGGRREACRQLASVTRVTRPLERMNLAPLKSKGRISFRDILGTALPEASAADLLAHAPEPIRRAIDETGVDEWSALSAQLAALLAGAQRIDAVFADKTPSQGPDLQPFSKAVTRLKGFADAVVAKKSPPAEPAPGDAAEVASAPVDGASIGGSGGGPIRTRIQAIAALDAVRAFLMATEPSNPAPLLIDRAKRLIGMDFMQIMENVAPGGVDDARRLLQPPEETPQE